MVQPHPSCQPSVCEGPKLPNITQPFKDHSPDTCYPRNTRNGSNSDLDYSTTMKRGVTCISNHSLVENILSDMWISHTQCQPL